MISISIIGMAATLAVMSAAAAEPMAFPATLVGQWTDDLTHCGGEDTAGMTVAPTMVSFYEAQGTARTIRASTGGAITAELSYRGEGRAWNETSRFKLAGDGKTVTVSALGKTFDLKRCP